MTEDIFSCIPENKVFSNNDEKILHDRQKEYENYSPLFVKWSTHYKTREKIKPIINDSYKKCKNYLDKAFISIFPLKKEFYGRLWELFLCDFLITKNFHLIQKTKNQEKGTPDFCIQYEGKNIWIEAIASTEGEGKTIEKLGNQTYNLLDISIPRYKRLSSSFDKKSEQWEKTYINNGCAEEDIFIIAICGNQVDSWSTDKGILSILYGIGLTQIDINGNISYQNLSKIGEKIEVGYFNKDEFSHVSGVIYLEGEINFLNNDMLVEHNYFQFIPNQNAKNPVSIDFIKKLDLYIPTLNYNL